MPKVLDLHASGARAVNEPRGDLDPEVDVLVVGAGPTGLAVASLLGFYGARVLIVEQNETTSEQAKAISVDDESLRILQCAGLLDVVWPVILPGTGTCYYGTDGRKLVHARGPAHTRHGLPIKSAFQQPELERTLRAALKRFPTVRESFRTTLRSLSDEENCVTATLERADGSQKRIRSAYVLGCDGGRSTVRRHMGVHMAGSSFAQPWIVIDTVNDPHHERYGMHHADPRRPHVIIPGRNGHCRYEFLLRPGEVGTAGDQVPFPMVRELLAPYRSITEADVVRRTVYTFNALVAERWRRGRSFVLGDAAHMMPPFAGQGLNAGIRDAGNLAWKLAMALRGRAGDQLLDTYEVERRPHAEEMVRLSIRLGEIVMTTDARKARVRDLLVRAACLTPQGRRYLGEMRYRRPADYSRGAVVRLDNAPARIVGQAMPQPWVIDLQGRRTPLDDALGAGFALVAVDPTADILSHLTDPTWDRLGVVRLELMTGEDWARPNARYPVLVDEAEHSASLLRPYRANVLLVRPDRYVAAAFRPAQESDVVGYLSDVLDLASAKGSHSSVPSVI